MKPFVQKMETEKSNNEETMLRKQIEVLKKDIEVCPKSENFDVVRNKLKEELKEKEKSLLQLTSGSSSVLALDALDSASQFY